VLKFEPDRVPVEPRPAATLILLREPLDATGAPGPLEVLVMQRSLRSSFMGGAVVFPGGRVEPEDAAWDDEVAPSGRAEGPWWDHEGRAARIAACREALEEVGVVPLTGGLVRPIEIEGLRRAAAGGSAKLREALAASARQLDVEGLVPFARWVTPEAEPKRFDARFFVAKAPIDQIAISDEHEAVRVAWETPAELLRRAEAGELTLFPPTHRTLALLREAGSVARVLADATRADLEIICPRFALDEGVPVLALPGDRLHEIAERRVAGGSRFALRGERWVEEDAPRKDV
jgi:8-oxo-dGTP pyrophosphatase MutT (NUDIX family)